MNWYYATAGQQTGPVSEEELQSLAQQGVVTSQTLVWREGMANWQPYGEYHVAVPPSSTPLTLSQATCANCGGSFPRAEVVTLSGRDYCASCKPVALQQFKEGVVPSTGAEEIRRQYLKHEASVKSIGLLYYLGGVALLIAATIGMVAALSRGSGTEIGTAAFLGFLSVLQFWVGTGIRKLQKWARLPIGLFSGIGLLGFPIGTLVNGYILYLVFSKKGRMVFSDEYHDVIEQTPHIKYRTSIVVWILLGLVLLLILVGLAALLLGKRG